MGGGVAKEGRGTTAKFGAKIPRLWHKNKQTPRLLVVVSLWTLVGCC